MRLPWKGGPQRPKLKTPDDRMTLMEHLAELRVRIIRCVLAVDRRLHDRDDLLRADPELPEGALRAHLQHRRQPQLREQRPVHPEPDGGVLDPRVGVGLRRHHHRRAGAAVAAVALHRARGCNKRERQYAIPFIVSSVFLFFLGAAIAYWTLDKALAVPDRLLRPRRQPGVPDLEVHQPRRLDDRRLRHRSRVPGDPRVPAARRRAEVPDAVQVLALRDRRDRRHRGGDHPQRRPDQPGRAGHPDARSSTSSPPSSAGVIQRRRRANEDEQESGAAGATA